MLDKLSNICITGGCLLMAALIPLTIYHVISLPIALWLISAL